MKLNRSLVHTLILFLAAGLIYSCGSEMQSKNNEDKDSTSAVPVEAASTVRGTISAYYSTTATLEAEGEAMVVAKVKGIVKEIYVEEGDYVEAGQALVQLEDEQLELEAERAKATMDRLSNDLKRNTELFEKGLISVETFENSKFEFTAQKAAYELASLNLKHSTIRAPLSGIISQRLVKVGNMINANQEVYKVTDFDPLLAVLHIPEHEMNKLRKNQLAVINVDAVKGTTFRGEVLRISPVVNPQTGTFKVTVAVADASRQLKPGMFGRIRIVYDTRENALMIPKNAVLQEDGNSSVFVINENMVYRRAVQTGYVNGSNIEVIMGLMDGDEVVTVGQSSLQDSTLVQVVSY